MFGLKEKILSCLENQTNKKSENTINVWELMFVPDRDILFEDIFKIFFRVFIRQSFGIVYDIYDSKTYILTDLDDKIFENHFLSFDGTLKGTTFEKNKEGIEKIRKRLEVLYENRKIKTISFNFYPFGKERKVLMRNVADNKNIIQANKNISQRTPLFSDVINVLKGSPMMIFLGFTPTKPSDVQFFQDIIGEEYRKKTQTIRSNPEGNFYFSESPYLDPFLDIDLEKINTDFANSSGGVGVYDYSFYVCAPDEYIEHLRNILLGVGAFVCEETKENPIEGIMKKIEYNWYKDKSVKTLLFGGTIQTLKDLLNNVKKKSKIDLPLRAVADLIVLTSDTASKGTIVPFDKKGKEETTLQNTDENEKKGLLIGYEIIKGGFYKEGENPVYLPFDDMRVQMFISGGMGSGKTSFIIKMMAQLLKKNIKVIFITPEFNEATLILQEGGNIPVIDVANINNRINILFPFSQKVIPDRRITSMFSNIISSVVEVGPYTSSIEKVLETAFDRLYADVFGNENIKDINEKMKRKNIIQFAEKVDHAITSLMGLTSTTKDKYERVAEWAAMSIEKVSLFLNYSIDKDTPQIFLDEVIDKYGGFVLSIPKTLDKKETSFIMGIFVASIFWYITKTQPEQEKGLKYVIIIDEFQTLMGTGRIKEMTEERKDEKTVEEIANIITSLRKRGVCVCPVTQSVAAIPSGILEHLRNILIFSQQKLKEEDEKKIAQLIGIHTESEEEAKDYLNTIKTIENLRTSEAVFSGFYNGEKVLKKIKTIRTYTIQEKSVFEELKQKNDKIIEEIQGNEKISYTPIIKQIFFVLLDKLLEETYKYFVFSFSGIKKTTYRDEIIDPEKEKVLKDKIFSKIKPSIEKLYYLESYNNMSKEEERLKIFDKKETLVKMIFEEIWNKISNCIREDTQIIMFSKEEQEKIFYNCFVKYNLPKGGQIKTLQETQLSSHTEEKQKKPQQKITKKENKTIDKENEKIHILKNIRKILGCSEKEKISPFESNENYSFTKQDVFKIIKERYENIKKIKIEKTQTDDLFEVITPDTTYVYAISLIDKKIKQKSNDEIEKHIFKILLGFVFVVEHYVPSIKREKTIIKCLIVVKDKETKDLIKDIINTNPLWFVVSGKGNILKEKVYISLILKEEIREKDIIEAEQLYP